VTLLDVDALDGYFATYHTRDAFRWEGLAYYDVDSDDNDYVRYLRGEPEPDAAGKSEWLDQLRSDSAAGRSWRRVHILRTPLSDYLRYECEWGYVQNVAAGEDVRIVDLTEQSLPDPFPDHDFWLLDGQHVVRMHYDSRGRFVGASVPAVDDVALYRQARDAAWAVARPFTAWWQSHPEFHRAGRST